MGGADDINQLEIPDQKKRYIIDRLNPLLEELVTNVVVNFPPDPADYMLKWLVEKAGTRDLDEHDEEVRNRELKAKLQGMKDQYTKTAVVGSQLKAGLDHGRNSISVAPDGDESDEGSDDDVDEVPQQTRGTARGSVSAEAYGDWNKKTDFTPPVHAKSDGQKKRIREVLSNSFIFNSLEDRDANVLVDAMQEVKLKRGTRVINQGENGDYLFVVEKGSLNCVKADADGAEKVVKVVSAHDVFGELALLYNTARQASVESAEDCVLWKLDQKTFNHIVRDAAAEKRNRYEEFLNKVALLEGMDSYERSQIADALQTQKASAGEEIIKQGEAGDHFYIIEEGEGVAIKDGKEVMNYKAGDFFGELALLTPDHRAASVKATTAMKLLKLERKTFVRMLGGLESILLREGRDKYGK